MGKGPKKPKATPEEKALKEISIKDWARYKETYMPLNEKLADRAMDTDLGLESARSEASGAVAQNFDSGRRATFASLGTRGVNPNSGASKMAMADLGSARAGAHAGTLIDADKAHEGMGKELQKQTISIGREIKGQAIGGMSSMNNINMQREQSSANAKNASNAALGEAVGSVAGLGGAYWMSKNKKGAKPWIPQP